MRYKRIETIEEAKQHFYRSDNTVIFETENGAKLCQSVQECIDYRTERVKEAKKGLIMKILYKWILWMIPSISAMFMMIIVTSEINIIFQILINLILSILSILLFLKFFTLFELIKNDKIKKDWWFGKWN